MYLNSNYKMVLLFIHLIVGHPVQSRRQVFKSGGGESIPPSVLSSEPPAQGGGANPFLLYFLNPLIQGGGLRQVPLSPSFTDGSVVCIMYLPNLSPCAIFYTKDLKAKYSSTTQYVHCLILAMVYIVVSYFDIFINDKNYPPCL